jgi:hypothetical protein
MFRKRVENGPGSVEDKEVVERSNRTILLPIHILAITQKSKTRYPGTSLGSKEKHAVCAKSEKIKPIELCRSLQKTMILLPNKQDSPSLIQTICERVCF